MNTAKVNCLKMLLNFKPFFIRSITLKPGDVILTGTPGGVGMHRKPAEFLKPGDLIESEIQCLGKLANQVVADC